MTNPKCPRCNTTIKQGMIYVGEKEGFICIRCAKKEQHTTDKPIVNNDGSLAIIRRFY